MNKEVAEKEVVLDTKRTDLMLVDPNNITVEPGFNVRKDMGDIEGLALSLVIDGLLVPIEGYKVRGEDRYVLTDGHRRLAAVKVAIQNHKDKKAGFEDISKIQLLRLIPTSSNIVDRLYIMAITGEKKKDLTDLEKSDMYNRLLEHGIAQGKKKGDVIKEILARLQISLATFYNILKINTLPEEIKEAIANNSISGGTVVTIVREIKDEAEQIKAVKDAISNAKAASEATGGKTKTKATASNVKGLKTQTVLQKLRELSEKLEKEEVTNIRTKLLSNLIEGLENKDSIKDLVKLFL